MSFVTVISLVLFLVNSFKSVETVVDVSTSSEPEVAGEMVIISSPDPSSSPKASASIGTTTIKEGDSSIHVSVNNGETTIKTNAPSTSDVSPDLVYPGATKIADGKYQTSTSGSTVYDWYKAEFEKKNYSANTNIKTQSNEEFKGVLAGSNGASSLKVTIDQENSGSQTYIILE